MDSIPGGLKRKNQEKSVTEKKRKHVTLTLIQKNDIIKKFEEGSTKAALARDYGVGNSTIGDIIKSKDKIDKFFQDIDCKKTLSCRKTVHRAKDDNLDKALKKWFLQERDKGSPISGDIIIEQAKIFHAILNKDSDPDKNFNPTEGFISKFTKRHGIREISIQGEKLSANKPMVEPFIEKLNHIIRTDGYSLEQLYNCDETGLFLRTLPRTTLASLNEANAEGYKMSKERVTILLCANAAGSHRLTPVFIGKFKKPRAIKNEIAHLPVIYKSSKYAWMTEALFVEWFHDEFVPAVKNHLRSVKLEEKALLLLDNAPVHCLELASRDGKIKIMFLPPYTTSFIQPMDQCIIASFKRIYKKKFLRKILIANSNSSESLLKRITLYNIKDCILDVSHSWKQVSNNALINAWTKLGFNKRDNIGNDDLTEDKIINLENTIIVSENDLRDLISADEDDKGYIYLSDESIVNEINSPREVPEEEKDQTTDDDNNFEEKSKFSHVEAMNTVRSLINYCNIELEIDYSSLGLLYRIGELAELTYLKELKQSSIKDYLK
jgi:hypothetical protein